MGVKITACTVKNRKVTLEYEDKKGKQTVVFDKLIVAVGRAPNSVGVIDESCKVKVDDRGFVVVDEFCQTDVEGVFAIGDLVRGPMLAHKGSEEGIVVAEIIAGEKPLPINLETVPSVIYTAPEIAWVGKTEQEVKAENTPYKVGKFPFSANGRARAINDTCGFIKVIAHAETDRILGVHMIGPQSSELIAQAKIAMDFGSSSEDLAMTMFAHPTLSEAFHEAVLSVDGKAIHAVQKKK